MGVMIEKRPQQSPGLLDSLGRPAILAGSGITVTANGKGGYTIAATGGGGGSSYSIDLLDFKPTQNADDPDHQLDIDAGRFLDGDYPAISYTFASGVGDITAYIYADGDGVHLVVTDGEVDYSKISADGEAAILDESLANYNNAVPSAMIAIVQITSDVINTVQDVRALSAVGVPTQLSEGDGISIIGVTPGRVQIGASVGAADLTDFKVSTFDGDSEDEENNRRVEIRGGLGANSHVNGATINMAENVQSGTLTIWLDGNNMVAHPSEGLDASNFSSASLDNIYDDASNYIAYVNPVLIAVVNVSEGAWDGFTDFRSLNAMKALQSIGVEEGGGIETYANGPLNVGLRAVIYAGSIKDFKISISPDNDAFTVNGGYMNAATFVAPLSINVLSGAGNLSLFVWFDPNTSLHKAFVASGGEYDLTKITGFDLGAPIATDSGAEYQTTVGSIAIAQLGIIDDLISPDTLSDMRNISPLLAVAGVVAEDDSITVIPVGNRAIALKANVSASVMSDFAVTQADDNVTLNIKAGRLSAIGGAFTFEAASITALPDLGSGTLTIFVHVSTGIRAYCSSGSLDISKFTVDGVTLDNDDSNYTNTDGEAVIGEQVYDNDVFAGPYTDQRALNGMGCVGSIADPTSGILISGDGPGRRVLTLGRRLLDGIIFSDETATTAGLASEDILFTFPDGIGINGLIVIITGYASSGIPIISGIKSNVDPTKFAVTIYNAHPTDALDSAIEVTYLYSKQPEGGA